MAKGMSKKPGKKETMVKMSNVSAYDKDDFGKDSIGFSLLNESELNESSCKFEEYENLQQELPYANLNEMEETSEIEEAYEDDDTESTFSGYKTLEDDEHDETNDLLDIDSYQCKYDEDTQKIREKFLKQYMIISNYMPYHNVDILREEDYLPE